eukprot:IDg14706t1
MAEMCVKQLKNSPPHYKNIVSTYHKYIAMGIYVEPNGKVWCTQSFSINTDMGSGKCAAIDDDEGSSDKANSQPTPTAKPVVMPSAVNTASTGYKFKTLTFKATMSDGTAVTPLLECATQCRYCFSLKGRKMCLSEMYSISIDKQLSM